MTPQLEFPFMGPPRFGGVTFDPDRDGERLKVQLIKVYALMCDSRWRTLRQIEAVVGKSPTQSCSARLRDLRKPRCGVLVVDKRHIARGVWEYRLLQADGSPFPRAAMPLPAWAESLGPPRETAARRRSPARPARSAG